MAEKIKSFWRRLPLWAKAFMFVVLLACGLLIGGHEWIFPPVIEQPETPPTGATTETITLLPNGQGDLTEWYGVYGAPTHWQACKTNDGDSSYIKTESRTGASTMPPEQTDLFEVENPPAEYQDWVIKSVTVVICGRSMSASYKGYVTPLLKTYGTVYAGTPGNPSTSYVVFSVKYEKNPYTGESWNWTEIEQLQIGVKGKSGYLRSGFPPNISYDWYEVRCTSVCLKVEVERVLYDNLGHTNNVVGEGCTFHCRWNMTASNVGLSGWIFSWNGTGKWLNTSWIPWSGAPTTAWSNITKRLLHNATIQYKFYVNDTDGYWYQTDIVTFQTVTQELPEPKYLIDYLYQYSIGLNYSESMKAAYFGLILNSTSEEEILDIFNSFTNYKDILRWARVLERMNITISKIKSKIIWALDHTTFAGELPASGTDSETGKKRFSINNAYLLDGYYWAQKFNHNLTAWNITEAYNWFKNIIGANVTADHPPLWILEDGSTKLGVGYGPRLYDEVCGAINCYLSFYEYGNFTEALQLASRMWEQSYDNFWSTYWIAEGYYKYAWGWDAVEWQSGGVFLRIAKLKYYNDSIRFDRMYPNFEHRALIDAWMSKTWCYNRTETYYAIVHSYMYNDQRFLHGTMRLWAALQQIYLKFNTSSQKNMTCMLEGSSAISPPSVPQPAWKLLMNLKTSLFDYLLDQFKWSSDGSPSSAATAAGLALMLTLGITPNTTVIALPLVESTNIDLTYYNPLLFQLDLIRHQLKLPVLKSGKLYIKLNTAKIELNFQSGKGIYLIKFSNDWNSILSITYLSNLPDNIPFLYTVVYESTELSIGWNNFTAWSVDVGHTLAEVNASLHIDNINWTVISLEYSNGSRAVLVWEQDTNEYIGQESAVVESGCTFYIYCKEAGEWYHNYP